MPHYKNGLAAKVGDVVVLPYGDGERAGTVATIYEGSDSCNASVIVLDFVDAPSTLPSG